MEFRQGAFLTTVAGTCALHRIYIAISCVDRNALLRNGTPPRGVSSFIFGLVAALYNKTALN